MPGGVAPAVAPKPQPAVDGPGSSAEQAGAVFMLAGASSVLIDWFVLTPADLTRVA